MNAHFQLTSLALLFSISSAGGFVLKNSSQVEYSDDDFYTLPQERILNLPLRDMPQGNLEQYQPASGELDKSQLLYQKPEKVEVMEYYYYYY